MVMASGRFNQYSGPGSGRRLILAISDPILIAGRWAQPSSYPGMPSALDIFLIITLALIPSSALVFNRYWRVSRHKTTQADALDHPRMDGPFGLIWHPYRHHILLKISEELSRGVIALWLFFATSSLACCA